MHSTVIMEMMEKQTEKENLLKKITQMCHPHQFQQQTHNGPSWHIVHTTEIKKETVKCKPHESDIACMASVALKRNIPRLTF